MKQDNKRQILARVPVVNVDGKPLSPTTPHRAGKLIKSGIAVKRWTRKLNVFYIQMTVEVGNTIPHKTVAGHDPGKQFTGLAVQTDLFTLLMVHMFLPFKQVKKNMETRAMLRRGRRYRKCPRRKKRFLNRSKNKLPPSIRANREFGLILLAELLSISPITTIVTENVAAKTSKLGKSFSPVMVGQKWMKLQLANLFDSVTSIEGWETSITRKHLNLEKNKADKSQVVPETHAVDAVSLAATEFVKYKPIASHDKSGYEWKGNLEITPAQFIFAARPILYRRALHVQNYAKGGVRRRNGSTTTCFDVRKGDLVSASKAGRTITGYVGGYSETNKCIAVCDANWHRYGQYQANKVQLANRSTGVLINNFGVKSLPNIVYI